MPAALDIPAAETAIVEMTNEFRDEHRLPGLTPNPQLAAAARAYAKVLAAREGTLSHTVDGTTPATRIDATGYAYCQIGENLAMAYDARGLSSGHYARLTLDGWKNSPGHRRNMLMPEVTDIGVAVAPSGPNDPRYIAVQLFARPRALQYTFRIVNRTKATVAYDFGGEAREVLPRQVVTHTSCAAGDIAFKLAGVAGRYEARDGRVYTLKPRAGGGVTVEVGDKTASP